MVLSFLNVRSLVKICHLAGTPNRGTPDQSGLHPFSPLIDVYENNGSLIIDIELAGIEKHNLSVLYKKGVLEISGRKDCQVQGMGISYYAQERACGTFKRAIYVNDDLICADNLTADLVRGVLHIVIPKSEQSSSEKIRVTIA